MMDEPTRIAMNKAMRGEDDKLTPHERVLIDEEKSKLHNLINRTNDLIESLSDRQA